MTGDSPTTPSPSRSSRAAPPPRERRQPLPEQSPKSEVDDPTAPERVRRLLASRSYRTADEDPAFLRRDDVRAARLGMDYLKPELTLEEHAVHHTIVVFGSTRIAEPTAAKRRVEALSRALAERPDDAELQRALRTATRVAAHSRYYGVARTFGRLVGAASEEPVGVDDRRYRCTFGSWHRHGLTLPRVPR